MYIFSINIIQLSESVVINEFPILLLNDSASQIIIEIRRMIKDDLLVIAENHNIPLVDIKLAISTIYVDDNILMHNFNINLIEVRETIEIIKNINNDD